MQFRETLTANAAEMEVEGSWTGGFSLQLPTGSRSRSRHKISLPSVDQEADTLWQFKSILTTHLFNLS